MNTCAQSHLKNQPDQYPSRKIPWNLSNQSPEFLLTLEKKQNKLIASKFFIKRIVTSETSEALIYLEVKFDLKLN